MLLSVESVSRQGMKKRMQTPGLYDDGRKVNLSQPTNGRGEVRSWTRGGDRVETTEQAAAKWPGGGSWRLVEMSRVKTISIPPVALSRSVGSGEVGGGTWEVGASAGRVGDPPRRGNQIGRRCVEPSS